MCRDMNNPFNFIALKGSLRVFSLESFHGAMVLRVSFSFLINRLFAVNRVVRPPQKCTMLVILD